MKTLPEIGLNRLLGSSLLVLALFSPSFADDISNNLSSHLNEQQLDVLAKDLGAVIGGGSFHQGKPLGFPLGFDLGIHVPVVGVQDDNLILGDDGSTTQSLWGQLELGLPGKINLIGRYGKLFDGNLAGGGFRYGILKSVGPLPSLSVSGLYSTLEHDFIDLKTISANLVLSFDLPFIHPYIGGGYDFSELELKDRAFDGVPASVSRDIAGKSNGYRAEAGINLSVIPFTYITLGAGLANSQEMYHAGAGVKF